MSIENIGYVWILTAVATLWILKRESLEHVVRRHILATGPEGTETPIEIQQASDPTVSDLRKSVLTYLSFASGFALGLSVGGKCPSIDANEMRYVSRRENTHKNRTGSPWAVPSLLARTPSPCVQPLASIFRHDAPRS